MKVLSLDLATCTGWAILENKEGAIRLIDFGNFKVKRSSKFYPYSYIFAAKEVAEDVESIYNQHFPDYIVVEDTNKGQQRYTQKFLEFIHFAVFDRFLISSCNFEKIYYISSSEWRKNQCVRLSKEQKSSNKKKLTPKVTLKHVSVNQVNQNFNLKLKQKDNDIADAILLGVAFLNGAKVSDGVIKKRKEN